MSVEGLLRVIKPISSFVPQIFTEYIFCPKRSTQPALIHNVEQKVTAAQHTESFKKLSPASALHRNHCHLGLW